MFLNESLEQSLPLWSQLKDVKGNKTKKKTAGNGEVMGGEFGLNLKSNPGVEPEAEKRSNNGVLHQSATTFE